MWEAAIPAGINLLGSLLGNRRRSASAEIPGLMETLQQSLQARTNALTYADAAANPDSPWFRNLSALYREAAFPEILRGVKAGMTQQQRLTARGVPVSFVRNPERRDEAFYSSLARMYSDATTKSRTAAGEHLLGASRAAVGGAPETRGIFDILNRYGQYGADRRSSIFGSAGELAKVIFKEYGGGRDRDVAGPGNRNYFMDQLERGWLTS